MLPLPLPSRQRIMLGKYTGMGGGFLGVLCVLGEFCFLFPDWLVSQQARPFYHSHLPLMHLILQASISASVVMGGISVLCLRSRMYGATAILLGMTAIFMGGAAVQPLTHHTRHWSAGLDYFVLELLLLALLFVPMERLWTLRESRVFRGGWQTDLKHFFLSHTGVQLLSFVTFIPAQLSVSWLLHLDFQKTVAAQPLLLQFFEILLCVDLVSYWVHRAFHKVSWLWKFHAIHHSSLHLDWLAGSRTHIVDVLVNRSLGFVPIFVLGFAPAAVYAYLVFVSIHAVYIHANVSHRWPYLRWVFATPEFHHWHHTSDEEGIDKNFAVFLAFIDKLFGTAHLPDYWPQRYGTSKFQPPESYIGQLLYPFRRQGKTPYG